MNYTSLLFKGEDYCINDKLTIHHPTLSEIYDIDEEKFQRSVFAITATPCDFKFQLYDLGIDYEEVEEFEFFLFYGRFIADEEVLRLFFGDVNILSNAIYKDETNGDLVLRDEAKDLNIDKAIYTIFTEYIRQMNYLKKNVEVVGNEYTKMILIDEQRENFEMNKDKDFEPVFTPMILAATNCSDFKYDYFSVMKLPLYVFLASVYRTQKQLSYSQLMTGVYTGNVDIKKIKKSQLQWL